MKFESSLAEQASYATTVALIRRKVIAAFERHGVKVTKVDAMTLKSGSDGYMGLDNLVERCRNAQRRHWDDIIEAHVKIMIESQKLSDPDYVLGLPDDEFYMRLRERVVPLGILRDTEEHQYSRPLVDTQDSPRRVLNLTFPDLALTLSDRYLKNRDMEAAWAFGRENTGAMAFDTSEAMVKDGIAIEVQRGDSIYLASKIADMPTLIANHLGEAPFGVLFAIPNAYEIDYYRPRDLDEITQATELLVGLAQALSKNTPNPLSRDVFFWRDGEFCQVSDRDEITPNGIFADTLVELADR
ncbi:hypothetical protein [Rhodococcus sovatensis]|uniref:Uncharacterized protein n=1 Tax=Rhodococcus sovatensis TaxID=1805840 RepID=A0ABZ2PLC3_9NOCA